MQQYNDSRVSFAKIPWYTESEPSTWRTLRLCASVTSRRSRLPERFMQRSSKRRFLLRVQAAQTVEVDNGTGPENVAGENVTISIFVADFSISVPRHDRQISSTGSSISLPSFSPSFFFFLPWLHWPRHREYIDSPPVKLLSRAVFYPLATTTGRESGISFRSAHARRKSSQTIPSCRPTGYANAWNAGHWIDSLQLYRLRNRVRLASKWTANDNCDPSPSFLFFLDSSGSKRATKENAFDGRSKRYRGFVYSSIRRRTSFSPSFADS